MTPDLLRLALLAELHHEPAHGYALVSRLDALGLDVPTTATGGLYRHLRALADDGLVESVWDTPNRGPARRTYSLTPAGEECLVRERKALHDYGVLVQKVFQRIPRSL